MLTPDSKKSLVSLIERVTTGKPETIEFWLDTVGSAFIQFTRKLPFGTYFDKDFLVMTGSVTLGLIWLTLWFIRKLSNDYDNAMDRVSRRWALDCYNWVVTVFNLLLVLLSSILLGPRLFLIALAVGLSVKRQFFFSTLILTLSFGCWVAEEWVTVKEDRNFYDPYAWLPESYSWSFAIPKLY
jgi:hypothetical protein